MATVNAFIRTSKNGNVPCAVRFRLSDGRSKDFFGKSKLIIYSNEWDKSKQRIKDRIPYDNKKRTVFNNSILDLKMEIQQAYEVSTGELDKDWLVKFFERKYNPEKYQVKTEENFFSLFEEFINSLDITIPRQRHYHVVKRDLQRFEKYYNLQLHIDSFDEKQLVRFREFLKKEYLFVSKNKAIYDSTNKKELPKERSDNTIIGILKKIRTFYVYLHKKEKTSNNPFKNYKIGSAKYGTPIYITKEERNRIAEFDFSFNPKLEIQRDIFIFQCLVGCRVSDLIKLRKENIHKGILTYIANKTEKNNPKTIEVPLSKQALKLVNKYADNNDPLLFPFISSQKYNEAIKNVFTLTNTTRSVTWLNPKTKKGEQRPLNEIASSHIARRTFIANLYSQVKDPNLIGSLSGHTEGSKAFARYRDINIDIKRDLIDSYLD